MILKEFFDHGFQRKKKTWKKEKKNNRWEKA
jgi:hypothetical protein